jgi:hypothetical protein
MQKPNRKLLTFHAFWPTHHDKKDGVSLALFPARNSLQDSTLGNGMKGP